MLHCSDENLVHGSHPIFENILEAHLFSPTEDGKILSYQKELSIKVHIPGNVPLN